MPPVVIIPARYRSTRFPGKVLVSLSGKPLIQHVYERVSAARTVGAVYVATDDRRVFDAVHNFGGRAVMTSAHHQSGTDRIAEALAHIEATDFRGQPVDMVVNVQGDEPLVRPEMVEALVDLM